MSEEIDLAVATTRDLNGMLHGLSPDTNRTCWRVLNPRGQHALAVGIDAPVRIEKEMRDAHRAALAARLRAAGFDGVEAGSFRRYGSARRLYHFHVDNAGDY